MELNYVYAMAAVIAAYLLFQVVTRRFDPFAPIWLFLVGYIQIYIIQALSYHDWAVRVRGIELVTAANFRAFWALLLMIAVYESGIGRLLSALLPRPPQGWAAGPIYVATPCLIAWGLYCSGLLIGNGMAPSATPEEALLRSFPFVMLVGGILLVVSGRCQDRPRPVLFALGLAIGAAYVLIWMFNAKRSHSLMGVLVTVCAFYVTRQRRPSWPVLLGTAFLGALVVSVAIGWRGNKGYETSATGFVQFLGDFELSSILKNMNIEDEEAPTGKFITYESLEYGGFLIMMDATPEKSEYDYGANYLRTFSTFIPRIVWPDKPLFGREQWVKAWIASSEMKRDMTFTGPAIGLLGATQLNGGAWGTGIVITFLGIFLSTCFEYFRRHASSPWAQTWWALSFVNAWFMVVTDDPMVWFYYNYGFTTMPLMIMLWVGNKLAVPALGTAGAGLAGAAGA